jgi:3-hydroxyacyl-CoA dehydrogenase
VLITSNTSGIPIHFMNEGRSEDFRKHFATHASTPPHRYLKLFEGTWTDCDPGVTGLLNALRREILGKTVLAKDTPFT